MSKRKTLLHHLGEKNICWLREKTGFAALLMSAVVESAASPLRMRRHIAIGTTLSLKKISENIKSKLSPTSQIYSTAWLRITAISELPPTKTVIKAWNSGQGFYSYSSLLSSSLLTLEVQQHNVLPKLKAKVCAVTIKSYSIHLHKALSVQTTGGMCGLEVIKTHLIPP